jgi:flagellar biogenesis protein FliO
MTPNVYAFTPVSGFMYLFKTFFYLGVFAVIFYLIMKYVFPKMGNFTKMGGHIQVLDRRVLELNVSVHLVQVGSKYFLLGSASKNISMLAEIPAKDALAQSQTAPAPLDMGGSFAEILAKVKAVLPGKKDEDKN